jgi:hypothetical protein
MRVSFLAIAGLVLAHFAVSPVLADGMPGDQRRRAPPPLVPNVEVIIQTPWTLDIPAEPCCRDRNVGIIAGVDAGAFGQRPAASGVPRAQVPPINVPPDLLAVLRQRLGLPPLP